MLTATTDKGKPGKCPVCRGIGKKEGPDGKLVICYRCRGTGQRKGTYRTK